MNEDKIYAEKKEVVYAYVVYNGWDHRVYPDGTVMIWDVSEGDGWSGDYVHMREHEDGYDKIKAAGLEVLK